MKQLGMLVLAAVAFTPLAAQAPADSAHAARRHQLEQRRETRLKAALGLTDDQAAKLKATEQRFREQRRAAFEQHRTVDLALRAQLRPGTAANADSVRKLLDARDQNEARMIALRRDEEHEIAGYLSPVQRAQLTLMRERRFAHMMGHGHGRHHGEGGQDHDWRQKQGAGNG